MVVVLHTVLFNLDEDAAAEAAMPPVIEAFNAVPGIRASVARPTESKERESAAKGQRNTCSGLGGSCNFTHVELLTADSVRSLRRYLHGDEHKEVWMPLIKPRLKEILVFDCGLEAHLAEGAPEGALVLSALFKLPTLTVEESMTAAAESALFSTLAGVRLSSFAPYGGFGMGKADLMEAVDWTDKSAGRTHCLTVVVDDGAALERVLSSPSTHKWLATLEPKMEAPTLSLTTLCVHAPLRCLRSRLPPAHVLSGLLESTPLSRHSLVASACARALAASVLR
jgi:hypothetical protein